MVSSSAAASSDCAQISASNEQERLETPGQPHGSEEPKAFCYFDCGSPRVVSTMVRNSTRGVLMCVPCNLARRALEYSARRSPGIADAIARMKDEDPEGWKAKVRFCRIRELGEKAGVVSMSHRRGAVGHAISEIVQSVGVRTEVSIKWCNEGQFIAHHVYKEFRTETEARELWQIALNDPDIAKTSKNGSVEVAVRTPRKTVGYRERSSSSMVSSATPIETVAEAERAMHDLSPHGASAHVLQGAAFGRLGDVFSPGAAVQTSEGQSALGALPAGPPPVDSVMSETNFEPSGGTKRPAEASEAVVAPKSKSRSRSLASKSGVTGELLQARNEVLAKVKHVSSEFVNKKNNRASHLDAMYVKAKMPVPEDVKVHLARYMTLCKEITATPKEVNSWTVANVQENVEKVNQWVSELEVLATTLGDEKAKVQSLLTSNRKEAMTEARKMFTLRDRSLKVYTTKGTPTNLARFLYGQKALVPPVAPEARESSGAALEEDSGAMEEAAPAQQEPGKRVASAHRGG